MKNLILCGATAISLFPLGASAADPLNNLVKDGKFFGEMRYRYEYVDQDGISNHAKASTLRTNVGFQTGVWESFQGLLEMQLVNNIGADSFNDQVNGKTQFPIVADPDGAEVNQLWVSWAGLPQTEVKLGRQAINLDNQRFVGTVNWRQNDQTFDALMLTNKTIENLVLNYSFVGNVNRINGGDHPSGDLDTLTHILHGDYKVADWLDIVGYGYLMDIHHSATNSTATYGLRLTGTTPINDAWSFMYEAEGATQRDYANNTADYSETYYHLLPGVKGHGFTIQGGYEVLGGDGTDAFKTPLATLHKFNGWADKFLTTPANGLEDLYGTVSYKFTGFNEWIDETTVTAAYHDFDADHTSANYGNEWNLELSRAFKGPAFTKGVNVSLKYADYNADDLFTDTQKAWFTLGVKF